MSGIVTDAMVEVAAKALFDRKEAEKTNGNLRWVWKEFGERSNVKAFWRGEARTALEAALALVPHPPEGGKEAGEPVAWRWEQVMNEGDWQTGFTEHGEPQPSATVRNVTPLFARPPRAGAEKALSRALDFIESLTADPLIMGVDDLEMTLEDVQAHARIELDSIRAALSPIPARDTAGEDEAESPCPVCGSEERGQGGYLSCECPSSPVADRAVEVARDIWLYFRGRDETPVEAGAWFDNHKTLGGPARVIELVRSAALTAPVRAAEGKDEPVAWRWDQATNEGDWATAFSEWGEPEASPTVNNVTPLYSRPPSGSVEKALTRALYFIESLTADPILMGVDDIEMALDDVQAHARIELASIRKSLTNKDDGQ